MEDQEQVQYVKAKAQVAIGLSRGDTVLLTYQNRIVGRVLPVYPIPYERPEGPESVRTAWLAAQEAAG